MATATSTTGFDIGFIGGGNMAEAIVRGLIAAGWTATRIVVAEPVAERRSSLAERYGIAVTDDNAAVVKDAPTVVLAVKPQILGDVLAGIATACPGSDALFVSIAAGVPLARLEAGLGDAARVVRVMPNTPCLVGKGASVLCPGVHATTADLELATGLFAAVGDAHVVADEELLHLVTALSGSGPAYVYRFAEALVAAAVASGMDEALARSLTFQTIAGAAAMMIETGESPEALRRAVSSPGGTTLAGLARLDEGGFVDVVAAGLQAAAARSRELAKA